MINGTFILMKILFNFLSFSALRVISKSIPEDWRCLIIPGPLLLNLTTPAHAFDERDYVMV